MRLGWFSVIPLAVFCVAFVPSASQAQNLLVNPNFNTSLSGWNIGAIGSFDGTMDADGARSSGSAKGTHNFPMGGSTFAVAQCVTGIVAGQSYDFGGKIFVTSGPASRVAWVGQEFLSDNSCKTFLSQSATTFVTSTGSWVASTVRVTAPGGAMCACVGGDFATSATDPGQVVVNFDDMFFQPTPLPPVPALGAAGLIALALALGGIGLFLLRKLS